MFTLTKVVDLKLLFKLPSALRTYNTSHNYLRNTMVSPACRCLRTLALSTTQSPRPLLQGSYTHTPASPFPPTQGHFQYSYTRAAPFVSGNAFLFKGRQSMYFVKLFHTHRTCSAKQTGSGVTGSPNKNQSALIYIVAVFILMLGGAYAGVPLYKVFCQVSGLGGQAVREQDSEKIENMQKVDRQIRIRFNADVASSMRWNFKPQQTEVTVLPGETALAFYTARNPTDKPIIGISTYNVLPYDAGQYFNKIQCFCFEEQRLNPKEQVDMPVFFFIDPEFADDPKLEHVDTITLSYTFFEATEGLTLPLPGYPQPHDPIPNAS